VAGFVDRVVLRRADYDELRRTLADRTSGLETPAAVLDATCEALAPALTATRVTWAEADAAALGARAAWVDARHQTVEVPVHTTDEPAYVLTVARWARGVACCPTTWRCLEAAAVLAARRVDVLRVAQERWDREAREREIRRLATEAELRALRAQLNPHFLFNALTTVGHLMQEAPDRALSTLLRLTGLLRAVLKPTAGDLVPLGEEMEIVESYLPSSGARSRSGCACGRRARRAARAAAAAAAAAAAGGERGEARHLAAARRRRGRGAGAGGGTRAASGACTSPWPTPGAARRRGDWRGARGTGSASRAWSSGWRGSSAPAPSSASRARRARHHGGAVGAGVSSDAAGSALRADADGADAMARTRMARERPPARRAAGRPPPRPRALRRERSRRDRARLRVVVADDERPARAFLVALLALPRRRGGRRGGRRRGGGRADRARAPRPRAARPARCRGGRPRRRAPAAQGRAAARRRS
jgi:hypothetical protein